MSWLDKIVPSVVRREDKERRTNVPEGLWKKCVKCEAVLYRPELDKNLDVCPKCDHHMRMGARRRIAAFLDEGNSEEVFSHIEPIDRLKFKDKKTTVCLVFILLALAIVCSPVFGECHIL